MNDSDPTNARTSVDAANGQPEEIHQQTDSRQNNQPAKHGLPTNVVDRTGVQKNWSTATVVRRAMFILLPLAAIGVTAWVQRDNLRQWATEKFAAPEPAPTIDPATRPIIALGRLEPEGEVVEVAAPSGSGDARIETLNVKEGSFVKAGDILAVLDNETRLKAELSVAQQKLKQSEAQLEQTEVTTHSTIAQLKAELQSAKATTLTAEVTLKRQQTLRSSTSVSEEELDQSRLAVQNAKQKVSELEARLTRYEPTEAGKVADIEVAQQAVEVARTNVELAEAMLTQAYITAPRDGYIFRIELRPGERVGQPALLQMGSIETMYARLEVYESEVPKLKLDATVELSATAFGTPLQGTVSQISQLVKKQTIVNALPAANTDARVVEVMVRLDQPSADLAKQFVGMQVTASIEPNRSPAKDEPLP